ncbi:MAG TPA: DUF4235 domain-containing protein [Solirubrobacterales bacterium]|nr:DUF4235 domain-containing protein [Solirubrobacterales bacterium]
MKVLFIPVSIAGGILAGLIGKKAFERVWGLVDDQEPPDAQHRDVSYPKMVVALALEGAIFRAARGVFDHEARRGFARLTGRWPGEQAPDPE